MNPQPIDTAPAGDGWILGHVQGDLRPAAKHLPWVILTRCDDGWCDDEGYVWQPSAWVALPDPQPAPTGWRPAEGVVVLSRGWIGEERTPTWVIGVTRLDGTDDPARDWMTVASAEDARRYAVSWAAKLGLPIRVDDTAAGNVISFPAPCAWNERRETR